MEEAISALISDEIMTLIKLVFVVILGLWIKSLIDRLVQGIVFMYGNEFNQGDQVFIDGERAVIISTGLRRTIFEIDNGRGKTWRYIDNTKLKDSKFEKIIIAREVMLNKRRRATDKVENE